MEIVPTVRESALYMSVKGPHMEIGLVWWSCDIFLQSVEEN